MNDLLTTWSAALFAGKWLFVGLIYLALLIILGAVRQEARWRLAGGEAPAHVGAGRLRVLEGGADKRLKPGYVIPLRPVTTLGAKSGNTIVLNDPYVSSRHARLTWDGTAWYVEDLGSANGTVVDEKPCRPQTRCPLPFGARLRLGPVVLELLA
jgi:hypothetical protein